MANRKSGLDVTCRAEHPDRTTSGLDVTCRAERPDRKATAGGAGLRSSGLRGGAGLDEAADPEEGPDLEAADSEIRKAYGTAMANRKSGLDVTCRAEHPDRKLSGLNVTCRAAISED